MTRVAWVIGGLAWVVERVALVVLLIGGLGMVLSTLAGMTEIVGVQILGSPCPGRAS
jgi:hypothetical protein